MIPSDANNKWIYSYGSGTAEGGAGMKNLLGGKGAGLAEMSRIGLPVPPGFTITTEVCTYYYAHGNTYPPNLDQQIQEGMAKIEETVGKKFGDPQNPLLVAVRSGARVSMPGMMDTVLNLGLNDETVEGLAALSGSPRFAYDSYRRFIQMYSNIVMCVKHDKFEHILSEQKKKAGVKQDHQLTTEDLKEVVKNYKQAILEEKGVELPQDTKVQLWEATNAVFGSWNNERANTYRKLNDIPHDWGTAVNIVAMVFGNMGEDCATGVAFTRNPSNGDKEFYGEYLVNAQGEDVVAGIRTPQQISIAGKNAQKSELPAMEEVMPEIFKQLLDVKKILENHYKDMQDIEFTIQNSKLYMLQQRSGKRTARAAVKIAVDMFNEGLIDKGQALCLVQASSINQLLHPQIDPNAKKELLTRGLPASPGAAWGKIVLSAEEAEEASKGGEHVILVREETSPDDITGMNVAKAILTCRGGMTSHAAVVARGMGRPCICGAGEILIDHHERILRVGTVELRPGDVISVNGDTGEVFLGKVPTIEPELSGEFGTLMEWADDTRRLKIRANAETPKDAAQGRKFGAQGIGLVRTEHMFFEPKRILSVRKMILAESDSEKLAALEEILPYQTQDFLELFKIMHGLPVTIRLLDPPLHEFLPKEEFEMVELSKVTGIDVEIIKRRTNALRELNPMLGNRGCRLGISRPEITEMQARAIFTAEALVKKETGESPIVEVMIPLAFSKKELDILKVILDKIKKEVEEKEEISLDYLFGTMIELPRAALLADELAQTARFFSFGTNDLTQTTFGISRDDFTFHDCYKTLGIIESDPFAVLDQRGVGQLVEGACIKGRSVYEKIKLGICGEHGGDPQSIKFADKIGLDYVSCSPFRIPIARLAAAQATVLNSKK